MKRIITRGQAPIQVNGDNIISHMVRFVKTFFNFLIPKVKKSKAFGIIRQKMSWFIVQINGKLSAK